MSARITIELACTECGKRGGLDVGTDWRIDALKLYRGAGLVLSMLSPPGADPVVTPICVPCSRKVNGNALTDAAVAALVGPS